MVKTNNKAKMIFEKFYNSKLYYMLLTYIILSNIFFLYKFLTGGNIGSYLVMPRLIFLNLILSFTLYKKIVLWIYSFLISCIVFILASIGYIMGSQTWWDIFTTVGVLVLMFIISLVFGIFTYKLKK